MYTDPEIFETQDGSHSLIARRFGVSYHSKYGAIQESRHVFIDAGLKPFLASQGSVAVFEAGLGTGLNAFLTYLEAEKWQVPIYYEAAEAYPIDPEFASGLNYPDLLDARDKAWVFRQLHEQPWGEALTAGPYFTFRKLSSRIESLHTDRSFDVVYYDAFAPGAQPELWETEVLGIMYAILRPGGALVTYCAKGEVKRRLKSLGFALESLQGPPGKREMIRAVKQGAGL